MLRQAVLVEHPRMGREHVACGPSRAQLRLAGEQRLAGRFVVGTVEGLGSPTITVLMIAA